MQRVTTLSSSNLTLSYVFDTSRSIRDLEVKIASGKASQTYSGIEESQARRLLDLETTRSLLDRYAINNDAVASRLEATETAMNGITRVVSDFRNLLLDVGSNKPLDSITAENLQDAAFRSLRALESFFNTDYDGQFLFAGNRKTTEPVDFGFDSLSAFQSTYDGNEVVYPQTRAAHVETSASLGNADHGGLTFIGPDTIQATTAGSLAGLTVGATITIGGTAGNNKTFTIVDNDTTSIKIAGTLPALPTATAVNGTVAAEVAANATITTQHWYAGDNSAQTHRVSANRTIQDGLTAIDPAFEKAIRAMGLIAQGEIGTVGEFVRHPERVDQALKLLSSALDRAAETPQPFGTEADSNIEIIQQTLGFEMMVMQETTARQRELIGYLEADIAEIENADITEAITLMTNQTLVLEASYQTISRVRQLNLTNFL